MFEFKMTNEKSYRLMFLEVILPTDEFVHRR